MFFQQKRGKKTSLFLLIGLGFIFNRTGENIITNCHHPSDGLRRTWGSIRTHNCLGYDAPKSANRSPAWRQFRDSVVRFRAVFALERDAHTRTPHRLDGNTHLRCGVLFRSMDMSVPYLLPPHQLRAGLEDLFFTHNIAEFLDRYQPNDLFEKERESIYSLSLSLKQPVKQKSPLRTFLLRSGRHSRPRNRKSAGCHRSNHRSGCR